MEPLEYAPAPESRSIVDLKASYGLFVDGAFIDGHGKAFKSINPATEEVLAEVACADDHDVDLAVRAARRAYDKVWSRMPGAERAKYLYRIARIIAERSRELAVLESIDNGKPIRESRDIDVPLVSAHFFYYAGWADKLKHAGYGDQSLGVAAQVIPWNFPLLMLAWKIAPALACGNTVVLKPAETTPLTALLFAEICQQAELPPGVVNIVTGAGATGQALVGHDDVDKVAFTGSTDVGRQIARTVAGTSKRVTLELGGKAANIVFDDAPLDQAVEGIVDGIFLNQGQVCCAGSRLLVQESVAEDVLHRLKRRMATLRVGDPLDKNTDVGAINSAAQLDRIRELVAVGEAIQRRLLVRVLAVAQRRDQLGCHRPRRRKARGLVDRGEPAGDRRIVGGGRGERLGRHRAAELRPGGALGGLQLGQEGGIVRRIGDDGDEGVVLRRRSHHRRTADVDVLDHLVARGPARHGLRERIEVDDDEVDRADAVLGHRRGVRRIVAHAEQAAVHDRVQRLDPAVHHLGKAGQLGDVAHRQPRLAQAPWRCRRWRPAPPRAPPAPRRDRRAPPCPRPRAAPGGSSRQSSGAGPYSINLNHQA